jgi:hypothetical protein
MFEGNRWGRRRRSLTLCSAIWSNDCRKSEKKLLVINDIMCGPFFGLWLADYFFYLMLKQHEIHQKRQTSHRFLPHIILIPNNIRSNEAHKNWHLKPFLIPKCQFFPKAARYLLDFSVDIQPSKIFIRRNHFLAHKLPCVATIRLVVIFVSPCYFLRSTWIHFQKR